MRIRLFTFDPRRTYATLQVMGVKIYNTHPKANQAAFSLMEALVTIAIIGTMALLLIPSISPMKQGSSVQVARQQQAELQTALGSWIAAASAGPGGLAAARGAYNSAGSKLGLLQNYLQPSTYAMFSGSGSSVTSEALTAAGASLQFSSWGVDSAPAVTWIGQ